MSLLHRSVVFSLVLLSIGLAGRNETIRLVEVKLQDHDIVYTLNDYRLTIVDAGENFARALANDREIDILRGAGYDVAVIIEDYQAYKDDIFQRGFYHTYDQLYTVLDSFVTDHSDICLLDTIGFSVQGRAIWAIRVTDNPQIEENEPEIRLAGNIHGDEHIGTEITLYFLRHLLEYYTTLPEVQALVDNSEIWIVPTINPDGKVANTRRNANYVDLNRDYGYFWDGWGGSPGPSSQVESQVMMQHLEANNISLEYNYHSSAQYVNYPWDYHPADPADSLHIIDLSETYATLANLVAINGYDWYQTPGSLQDYTIGTNGTLAWTIETFEPSSSSAIDQICFANREALMEVCEQAALGITGIVKDSLTDSLLYARIEFTDPERIDIYTDPLFGDFHKMIEAGTYELRVSVNGYASKAISDVNVTPQSTVSIDDILLVPDSTYHHAFKVVINRYADHDEQGNKTQPRHALGPADSIWFSLGQSGYVVLDMGSNSLITDGPGDDFTVFEGDDGIDEGYQVYASNDWGGSWLSCGTDNGTANFDLATAGMTEARYLRIVDDGGASGGQYGGFDLDAIHVSHATGITSGHPVKITPSVIKLSVLPNPFRQRTDIRYQLTTDMAVSEFIAVDMSVYDAAGCLVRNLVNGLTEPGHYTVTWNGQDNTGRELPAGVYFARLSTGFHEQYEKIVILR
ncbi:MAG: succinylglutamate desuccinylase/aspartoacylase family protein [candidate division WOR-3 bacterium]|nr:MAG: succinylglutamate desuccinylase/aspartoacylase family protein [candidate division WOR-3 bacterium]